MSEAPGGGGYLPCRCMMSGRLTPAAATRMRTSPARGSGTGRSTSRSTSGPPNPAISIARMTTHLYYPDSHPVIVFPDDARPDVNAPDPAGPSRRQRDGHRVPGVIGQQHAAGPRVIHEHGDDHRRGP